MSASTCDQTVEPLWALRDPVLFVCAGKEEIRWEGCLVEQDTVTYPMIRELEPYVECRSFLCPSSNANKVVQSRRQDALEAETDVVVFSASDIAHTAIRGQGTSIFESMAVLTYLVDECFESKFNNQQSI